MRAPTIETATYADVYASKGNNSLFVNGSFRNGSSYVAGNPGDSERLHENVVSDCAPMQ
jgi:hypothetical protein